MSAEVIKYPERIYRPNLNRVFAVLDDIGDNPAQLIAAARWALEALSNDCDIIKAERREARPDEAQGITNLAATPPCAS